MGRDISTAPKVQKAGTLSTDGVSNKARNQAITLHSPSKVGTEEAKSRPMSAWEPSNQERAEFFRTLLTQGQTMKKRNVLGIKKQRVVSRQGAKRENADYHNP